MIVLSIITIVCIALLAAFFVGGDGIPRTFAFVWGAVMGVGLVGFCCAVYVVHHFIVKYW